MRLKDITTGTIKITFTVILSSRLNQGNSNANLKNICERVLSSDKRHNRKGNITARRCLNLGTLGGST